MATSPLAHHKTLRPLPDNNNNNKAQKNHRYGTRYLLSKIKRSAQMTKTLWPSKQEDNHLFSKSIITVYLSTKTDCCGWELKISELELCKRNPLRLQCVHKLTLWIAHSQLWPNKLPVYKAAECLFVLSAFSGWLLQDSGQGHLEQTFLCIHCCSF